MRITGVFLLILVMAATGCQKHVKNNLPPSEMLMHPGPGVDGPGPGVMTYQPPVAGVAAPSQLYFVGPEGMTIHWDVTGPGRFDSEALVAPARYNFPQGALYRLKLANIPGKPGVELYPTLELAFALPRSEAFLAHNAIPIQFTEEDFEQVLNGNFVTKVIYLPDPAFQEMALAGVETLVSTRLDPGVDPITEADRRGAILAVVRLGNKDLQIPSPAMVQDPANGAPMAMGGMPFPMAGMAANGYVAGVTGPQYGMPISGTPIGLAGPPHVPLGVPAGLQKHTIVNHTRVSLPEPNHQVRIDVKQKPGLSYPAPANRARIVERDGSPLGRNRQPLADRRQVVGGAGSTGPCPVAAPAAGDSGTAPTAAPAQPCPNETPTN